MTSAGLAMAWLLVYCGARLLRPDLPPFALFAGAGAVVFGLIWLVVVALRPRGKDRRVLSLTVGTVAVYGSVIFWGILLTWGMRLIDAPSSVSPDSAHVAALITAGIAGLLFAEKGPAHA